MRVSQRICGNTGIPAKRQNDAKHPLFCLFFYACDCVLLITTDVVSIKHQELCLHKQLFWKMKYMWSVLSMKISSDVQLLQQAGICSCEQRSRKGNPRFYRFIYLEQIPWLSTAVSSVRYASHTMWVKAEVLILAWSYSKANCHFHHFTTLASLSCPTWAVR